MRQQERRRYSICYAALAVFVALWVRSAIPAGAVWEIRACCIASAYYGGLYSASDGAGGGLDYSQQDNPQLTVTDAACLLSATNLTSVTGGFTAQMKGNGLYLSGGTNLVAGWYVIKSVTDTNTVVIDRTAAPSIAGTGGTVRVGGACGLRASVFNTAVAGNTYYIKNDATHVASESVVSAVGGNYSAPIRIIGYNTARTDGPTSTNRPLLSLGAYNIAVENLWFFSHLRISGTADPVINNNTKVNLQFRNVSLINSSVTGGRRGILITDPCSNINCEFVCTNGTAFQATNGNQNIVFVGCYLHDSVKAIASASKIVAINSIIDTCTTGIDITNAVGGFSLYNCTLYSGTTGIAIVTNASGNILMNNIISTYTTGVSLATTSVEITTDYNDVFNCGTDYTNTTAGANDYDADPEFVDAANADFRIGANCKNKGFPGAFPGAHASCVGVLDSGAVQSAPAATASGGSYTWSGGN